MHVLAFGLGVVGFAVGVAAARLWWQASRIDTQTAWGARESGDLMTQQAAWIAALLKASAESAALNKRAAVLTAIAVACSSTSSLLGLFA